MPRITLIKPRQDTAANWTSVNPVLADGEEGIESDTGLRKLGDGATAWTALAYALPVPPGTYVQGVDVAGYATLQAAYDAANARAIATGSPVVVNHSVDRTLPMPFGTLPKRMATIYPNLIFTGPGVVHVPDGAGNYGAIFGAPIGTDLSGFQMEGMTVDVNATNNAVPGAGDMTVSDNDEARCLVFITNGDGVKVNGNRFLDVGDLVNGILANGDSGGTCDDFECVGNLFDDVGQAAFAHDCSVIYWAGRRCDISHNRFVARGEGLGGCTAAIELHGPGQKCEHNYVENFLLGGYAVTSTNGGEGVQWNKNNFVGVGAGIMLISTAHGAFTGPYGLRAVRVLDNDLIIDRDQWYARTDLSGGVGYCPGIFLSEGSDLPCRDVAIRQGSIRYLATAEASDAGVSYKDAPVLWLRPDDSVVDEDIYIEDVVTDGALSAGVVFAAPVIGGGVNRIKSRNPGSHVNLTGAYRVNVIVTSPGDITNFTANGNAVVDDRSPHLIAANVYLTPTGDAINCEAIDNKVPQCDDSTAQRNVIGIGVASKAFFIRQRTSDYWSILPIDTARYGSTLVDEELGKTYRQTADPAGTTWVDETGIAIPQELDHSATPGVVQSVNVRYQNALAAGSKWSWYAGATETARLEHELVGGTDGPLRFYVLGASGLEEAERLSAPADGETAILVRRNVGGALTLQRVSMGAADSGGSGFKVLRVPN